MTDFYPIYEVLDDADSQSHQGADVVAAELQQSEQMGSKRKFWFCDAQTSRWNLFKYSRGTAGEHWSEKVACEIAGLLGLPHARVELATYGGSWGALVEDLRPNRASMSLLHGNELMLEVDPTYQAQRTFRCSEHTVERVAHALNTHGVGLPDDSSLPQTLPTGVEDALGLFVGYLLLDAIIGNTDRHHENWGVIAKRNASGARILQLAGTYDHASSLGRELHDTKRTTRLTSTGKHGVPGYAERARSALYETGESSAPLSPRAAFLAAGELRPAARDGWLARCASVGVESLQRPLDRVHPYCMSETASVFAKALTGYNCAALLGRQEELAR